MGAKSSRRRRTQARRAASQQWCGSQVSELDTPCPLNDLTHPTRDPRSFAKGVNLVLNIEDAVRLGTCYLEPPSEDPIGLAEARLVAQKATECMARRESGRCAMLNCVEAPPALAVGAVNIRSLD